MLTENPDWKIVLIFMMRAHTFFDTHYASIVEITHYISLLQLIIVNS